jgi:hypothetical protein
MGSENQVIASHMFLSILRGNFLGDISEPAALKSPQKG